ncbi:MAG: tRNA (adenosine(37)-N6)-threonylcarbamoyltransferase complex dimerization subunit type 1 TsaB [Pseudomonadota bacterium]
MTKLLVIDAVTPACSVALFANNMLIASDYADLGRGHAERLVPMIAALPDRGHADTIAVNCGPGSFTGIRVGLSAAKALGIAWNVPVHGYSCLALVAHMAAQSGADGALSVVMQAGHGELFVQNFLIRKGQAMTEPETGIVSVAPGEAMQITAGRPVYGSGIDMLDGHPSTLHGKSLLPDARLFPAMQAGFADQSPSPIYVRAPDAKPASANPVNRQASPQAKSAHG